LVVARLTWLSKAAEEAVAKASLNRATSSHQ
jgi:hypothetical protein